MQNNQTMVFNHLSFPSTDIPATAGFFEKYLGCTITHRMDQAWLMKRQGFDIVIENLSNYEPSWPKSFHLGFELETLREVRELYDQFKADGIPMETEIFNNTRGSRFFCRGPGGIQFEINTREDMDEKWKSPS